MTATNQAVNFTAYKEFKDILLKAQDRTELPSYQHLIIGGVSGAMGPLSNAPIDTIKTRIQRVHHYTCFIMISLQSSATPGESGWSRFVRVSTAIYRDEGWRAFYKGLTPRLLRVAPGQAITFMVYEKIQTWLETIKLSSMPRPVKTNPE